MEGRPMEKMDNRVPKGPKRASQSQPSNERNYLERRRRDAYKGKEGNGGKWKIGVVEGLIQGRDGVIRGAELKAGKTHIERPLQLPYPL